MSQFKAMPIWRVDFLHGNYVGIQFANDVTDAVGVVSSVPTDASVNIIGGEGQAHITLAGSRGLPPAL